MGNFKKRLSSVLAIVLTAFTCLSSVPAKAAETTPEVTFVGVEHSPLVVGDTEVFYVSAVGAEKVQYRIFQNKIGTDKWEELTKGYTDAVNANEIASINALAKYEAGKYKLSIWVKKADEKGKFQNKTGDYDSYYITYLNCVNKDNNNRVYTNGDMNIEKDNYVVGETVKISGIKDISGMEGPYTYKLHIYDVNSNEWKFDKEAYRKDLSFVADKPGTYVLNVWAMASNSTLWAKEAKLNGRIYEAWKLKVIRVTEKVEEPEVNVTENNVIFGSEDAKKPMMINKNVNITGKNVAFNNVNVKGNIIVTGDYTTLNNVKIEGTLVLNPGVKGTVNLNNVTADAIEVLSGATNSIHFNNVTAKVINVNSKNTKEAVRIELKGNTNIERTDVKSSVILEAIEGSFGNVQILESENKAESFIELRGTFDKNIMIKTKATLKAAKDAKVSKVIVEPVNNEKITIDGNFNEVELNKLCTLITTSNSAIVKVITNSPATLELGKGSIVATLDQKGQVVTQTGAGTVQKKVGAPASPAVPSTGGGSSGGSGGGSNGGNTDTTVYVQSITLQSKLEMVVGNHSQLVATINPNNATNKTLTWWSSNANVATVDQTGKVTAVANGEASIKATSVNGKEGKCDVTVVTTMDNMLYTIVKIANKQPDFVEALDVEYNKQASTLNVKVKKPEMSLSELFALKDTREPLDSNDILALLSLYSSLDSLNVKINSKAISEVIGEILLDPKFSGKSLKDVLNQLTYKDFILIVNNCAEFKKENITLSMNNDSLTSITINGINIYGGTDKHISRVELRTALGITNSLRDVKLKDLKGKPILITIGTKVYTIATE